LANVNGTVQINTISDAEMVKLYSFKEKHGSKFNFLMSTSMPTGGQSQVAPHVTLAWSTLEGMDAVVELIKELQPKA